MSNVATEEQSDKINLTFDGQRGAVVRYTREVLGNVDGSPPMVELDGICTIPTDAQGTAWAMIEVHPTRGNKEGTLCINLPESWPTPITLAYDGFEGSHAMPRRIIKELHPGQSLDLGQVLCHPNDRGRIFIKNGGTK